MPDTVFSSDFTPDWEAFRACIERKGTPNRVHHVELFLDAEVQEAVCRRFGLLEGLDVDNPHFLLQRMIRIQRFLGYDYVRQSTDSVNMPLHVGVAEDTAGLQKEGGRTYVDESKGPITNWDEFERYPWPDPSKLSFDSLEWYNDHLPDDMCIVGSGWFSMFAELLTWLMGFETLCYALYDQRDLVRAISDRLIELNTVILTRMLEFDRVKMIWGSDDMGFKTGLLIGPDDLRELVLPGHRKMAAMAHAAGRPYLLHSCGKLDMIMEELIDDVRIDAKHSFEDNIEDVRDAKRRYGDRIAVLGGIDVDFLCREDEDAIRARVRDTLKVCLPGGGYCLGTGNSVANYIPLDNYLAMLDEGRRYKL
jgi:uroporphyrinogen decarboxylase